MLPDFPKSKQELEEILLVRLRAAIREKNVLARHATSIVQHEGDRMAYDQVWKTGKRVISSEYEKAEAGIMIPIEDVPELTGERLLKKIDEIADQIAQQTSRTGYKKIDEVITEAGGGVDAQGQALTGEIYLKALERMEMSFDPETLLPTFQIVVHPDMIPSMLKLKETVEDDPEFKKRYDELISRKLKDWRDRESNRRLVD